MFWLIAALYSQYDGGSLTFDYVVSYNSLMLACQCRYSGYLTETSKNVTMHTYAHMCAPPRCTPVLKQTALHPGQPLKNILRFC